MTHWATEYIGKPWALGAQGPDAYDCWNFVRTVMRDRFNVAMPDVHVAQTLESTAGQLETNEERQNWTRILTPREGDVVLLARSRLPVHIGICVIANGSLGVLHCVQGAGVMFQRIDKLKFSGWGSLQFYRRT